jgi:hypothetical protein
MKSTQYTRLAQLLTHKCGCTSLEIILNVGTVCPHKRMSELKDRGWTITRKPIDGARHGRYFGVPPGGV